MGNNFGEILKLTLAERGITHNKLSQMTNISKGHIYKILKDKNEPSLYVLNDISKAFKIDVSEYYKIASDFKSLDEYQNYTKLRLLIELKVDIEQLELVLNKVNVELFEFGLYKQVLYYSKGLILCKKYKIYKKSLDMCLKAINTKVFMLNRIDKYIDSDIAFAVMSLIKYNYFMFDKVNEAENIAFNVINIIDNMYFNEQVTKITLPKIIFRT